MTPWARSRRNCTRLQPVRCATQGRKEDEGYHYLPEVNFSVQGQDANAAWRGVAFIAQNLNVPVEVSFLWRNKDGAEHPGKPGTMRLYGK